MFWSLKFQGSDQIPQGCNSLHLQTPQGWLLNYLVIVRARPSYLQWGSMEIIHTKGLSPNRKNHALTTNISTISLRIN